MMLFGLILGMLLGLGTGNYYLQNIIPEPKVMGAQTSPTPTLESTNTPIPTDTTTPVPAPTLTPIPTPNPTVVPTLLPSRTPRSTSTVNPTPTIALMPTSIPTPTAIPNSAEVNKYSSEEIYNFTNSFGGQYGVDPNVIRHVAICESGFNANAKNGPYAGMFQFDAQTWLSFRNMMGEDPNPVLRFDGKASVQTMAYALSKGFGHLWPNCIPK